MANVKIYILDQYLQSVPVGIPGELHIGGLHLGRGYLQRPELTALKFIPNPFSDAPDDRIYKTGDLARYFPDGSIEFLGRIDHQVKIRGLRVELEEVESLLKEDANVKDAVVLAHEENQEKQRLFAYLVIWQEDSDTITRLRYLLKRKLPVYMIPSRFQILDKLPQLPSGKINRLALSQTHSQYLQNYKQPQLSSALTEPQSNLEQLLLRFCTEILRTEHMDRNSNFFEMGGHSLMATNLLLRIQATFGIKVPMFSFFLNPTIAETAKIITEREQECGQAEKIASLVLEII
jgi:acyl carrier protein